MLFVFRKEVLIISISTAVLVNLVVTQQIWHALHLLPFTNHEVMEQVRIQSYWTVWSSQTVRHNHNTAPFREPKLLNCVIL